jgi:hypothetical protein
VCGGVRRGCQEDRRTGADQIDARSRLTHETRCIEYILHSMHSELHATALCVAELLTRANSMYTDPIACPGSACAYKIEEALR